MATAEYQQRVDFFTYATQSAHSVLSNPALHTPDHPYIAAFNDMISYASLGVVDINNGLIHTPDTPAKNSVIILPLLHVDVERSKKQKTTVTISDAVFKNKNSNEDQLLPEANNYSAYCDLSPALIAPVITLTPYLRERDELSIGSALVHELDHAYRWWNQDKMSTWAGINTQTGRAQLEISAYRLEQQIADAVAPTVYAEAQSHINKTFKESDKNSILYL